MLRILNFYSLELVSRFYTVRGKKNSIIYLTPFIPLSFKGEGEEKKEGRSPS